MNENESLNLNKHENKALFEFPVNLVTYRIYDLSGQRSES
jgi:hypothetical protein